MDYECIVELKNITFSYGCHPVLENISLSIVKGETVGITGPNGAGKSTLLKIIAGLLNPSHGQVFLFGVEREKFREYSKISYVPQKAYLSSKSIPVTVEEAVALGLVTGQNLFRPLGRGVRQRVLAALDRVGLVNQRRELVSSLSGGQQQRVYIARALIREPKLLILDEPTNGLDLMSRANLYNLLKDLVQERNLTTIIVTHELDEIASLISRQVCLNKKACTCTCHYTENVNGENKGIPFCASRFWPV